MVGARQLERLSLCGFDSGILICCLHTCGMFLREFVFHGLDVLPRGRTPFNSNLTSRRYPIPLPIRAPHRRPELEDLVILQEYSLRTKEVLQKLRATQKDEPVVESIGLDAEPKDVMCIARMQSLKHRASFPTTVPDEKAMNQKTPRY